ncbi:MAG: AAA family ATPase [Caldilineaceae bacterium]
MSTSQDPLPPNRAQELLQLFHEFEQDYAQTEALARFYDALDEARQTARQNYAGLLTPRAQGATPADPTFTDQLLLKLLPYADSPRNRWRGAWLHPLPAITGDLRTWYEAAGWTQPDAWPALAIALWEFAQQCVATPANLTDACQKFSDLPYSTGFQSAMLSPILNALRPGDYVLLNQRTRNALNYFTGSNLSQALTAYPAANAHLNDLLRQLAAQLAQSTTAAERTHTRLSDDFLLFCQWLASERRYPLRTARAWALSVADDPWLWAEWREGNMVAMGWDELGDLSAIPKREFQRRRDSLLAQHPTWTKRSAEQVWRLARQIQEGDQIVAHDGAVALGMGVVTGSYYYTPELPLGHRHPVEWQETTPRQLPAGNWRALLTSLTESQVAQILHAPQLPPSGAAPEAATLETATPEPAAPVTPPDFVRLFGPIVEVLQVMGGGRTNDLLDALLDRLDAPQERGRLRRQLYRARRYLMRAGLLATAGRGEWRLSEAGQGATVAAADAELLFHEVDYQRQLDESLQGASPTIRRLAEIKPAYTTAAPSASDTDAALTATPAPATASPAESVPASAPAYSLSACAAATFVDEETLARWVRTVERKRQAIFYGPPGVGKTFLAEQMAALLAGSNEGLTDADANIDGFVEVVQFHAAYAYEDFVQGIRPQSGPGGQVHYAVTPGRFLTFCRQAATRAGRCVLIIDEINRADLARVFGELMYLLEYRERSVRLAADGRAFAIPANVRILGTMNTADRSIALVDHALRRRFAFISLAPDPTILRRFHTTHQTDFPIEPLIALLQRVNLQIGDPHYALGHSFFLRTNLAAEMADIWQMEIEPYLEEYFFDQPDRVAALRWQQVRSLLGL